MDRISEDRQVDEICDSFERALQAGDKPDVAEWARRGELSLRDRLRSELRKVDAEYRIRSPRKGTQSTHPSDIHTEHNQDLRPGQSPDDQKGSTVTVSKIVWDEKSDSEDVTQTPGVCAGGANGHLGPHVSPENGSMRQGHAAFQGYPAYLGKYSIRSEVGRGGFGIVYRAYDELLKREVALKVPRDTLQEQARQRFLKEAETAAQLEHPGLVPVYDAGEIDGVAFIASAFCSGINLSQWMATHGLLSATSAARIVRDLAEAMQHVHNRGVVHRDLKPANIMVTTINGEASANPADLRPRITDFGLARIQESQLHETRSSIVLGTPSYMAPEQIDPSIDDQHPAAADIYALGVILFELLTGERPFERDHVIEVMDAIRQDDPPLLRARNGEISPDLEQICLMCLNKMPSDRYATSGELAADLSRFLQGQPVLARSPGVSDRFLRWLSEPGRVYETGLLSVLIGLGVPAWTLLIIIFSAAEQLDVQYAGEMVPQTLFITTALLLPVALCGYHTLHFRRGWMKAGLLISVASVGLVLPPLFGTVFVFPELYARYPLGKIVAYTFLSLLHCLQVLQYGSILWLSAANSRSRAE